MLPQENFSIHESCFSGDEEPEEPPGRFSRRHPIWNDVANADWNNWRWQMQHAIRTTKQLSELIPFSTNEKHILAGLEREYKLSIPPYYFSLININNPLDPIRLQSVPSIAEAQSSQAVQMPDPLDEEKDQPVPGLTHRYPDRVLMVTTPVCSMYCRFCTRKRTTMERDGWDAPSRDEVRMIEYVQQHPEIHDVILSGGDALMLPPAKLRWYLSQLKAIDHVGMIRVGTRVPVTLPQKLFEQELIDILGDAEKVWIQTHFNHPREITAEAAQGCRKLINAGLPINNHSVLLKGVNDSVATMTALLRGLLKIKVRPYYLFHCDPVMGVSHLRTSIWKGLEIMEGLRGHMSGLGVPTYVVDGLHGAGKIPLMPNYLLSMSDQAVVLRNYEGLIFRYTPDGSVQPVGPRQQLNRGVSNLLSGNGEVLIPQGVQRLDRRESAASPEQSEHGIEPVVYTYPRLAIENHKPTPQAVQDLVQISFGPPASQPLNHGSGPGEPEVLSLQAHLD